VPTWEFQKGAIALNPYWFWKKFEETYEVEWKNLFAEKEPTSARKRSADEYLAEVLG
jgi:hypothetical protein